MAILVTGGLGYIGSHVCIKLASEGREVIIVDNLSNCSKSKMSELVKLGGSHEIKLYECDYGDIIEMTKIFANHAVDAVIHLAAYKSVSKSIENPLEYYHNNVSKYVSFLTLINKVGIEKLVLSSSATVYGNGSALPIKESSTIGNGITNPYGRTKYICELITKDFINASSTSVVILRYFNPIGAHPSGLIGDCPKYDPTNIMPVLIKTTDTGKTFTIFGNDYDTKDGTPIRDYIHITDLADAHYRALIFLDSCKINTIESFNIGTGKGTSVMELIKTMDKTRPDGVNRISYSVGERRRGDLGCVVCNCDKANKLLDWGAKHTIEDMCKDAWNFHTHSKLKN